MSQEQNRINEELKKREPVFWSSTSWIQLAYGVWVNQTVVGVGFAYAFSSVAVPQLRSSHLKLTLSQEAWFAGILPLTSPLGSLANVFILDRLGRRFAIISCVVPMALGWFCTGASSSAAQLITGRAITGFGAGMSAAASRIYCTEISLPKMRGVLGAAPGVAMAVAVAVQAVLGKFLKWNTICYICGGYMLILMLLYFFLPETPYYLVIKGSTALAERSLLKFRGKAYRNSIEMQELKNFRTKNDIHRLSLKETMKALLEPSGIQPMAITAIYCVFCQISGCGILLFWGVELFQNSKSSLDPYLSNIYMASTRLVGVIMIAIALFKVRRRYLALLSAIGVSVCAISIGVYIIYTPYPTIFPTIGYSLYMLFSVTGHITLPMLIMYEMVNLKIRGILGSICISWFNICIFAVNTAFPFIQSAFGLPATLIGFGICSFLGAIFLYIFLPETKGLTLQEIEDFFHGRATESPIVNERKVTRKILLRKAVNRIRMDEANAKENVGKEEEILFKLKRNDESKTSLASKKSTVSFKTLADSTDEEIDAKEKADKPNKSNK